MASLFLLFFKVLYIVSLVRILIHYGRPLHCAVSYAAVLAIIGGMMIMGGGAEHVFTLAVVTLARALVAAAYFGGLHALRDSKGWYAVLPFGGAMAFL